MSKCFSTYSVVLFISSATLKWATSCEWENCICWTHNTRYLLLIHCHVYYKARKLKKLKFVKAFDEKAFKSSFKQYSNFKAIWLLSYHGNAYLNRLQIIRSEARALKRWKKHLFWFFCLAVRAPWSKMKIYLQIKFIYCRINEWIERSKGRVREYIKGNNNNFNYLLDILILMIITWGFMFIIQYANYCCLIHPLI